MPEKTNGIFPSVWVNSILTSIERKCIFNPLKSFKKIVVASYGLQSTDATEACSEQHMGM